MIANCLIKKAYISFYEDIWQRINFNEINLTGKEDWMKRFKVQLHGKNFLLNIDGELKKYGFYATKFVEAENPQTAEKIAVILIRQSPNLRETVFNESTDRPRINLKAIEEVSFFKFFANKTKTEFSFYPEDEK
jgi:hypothetical protein